MKEARNAPVRRGFSFYGPKMTFCHFETGVFRAPFGLYEAGQWATLHPKVGPKMTQNGQNSVANHGYCIGNSSNLWQNEASK